MLLATAAHCRFDLDRIGELHPKRMKLPPFGESLPCEGRGGVYQLLNFFFWSCSHT